MNGARSEEAAEPHVLRGGGLNAVRRGLWRAEHDEYRRCPNPTTPRDVLWGRILARKPFLSALLCRRLEADTDHIVARLRALSLRLNPDPAGKLDYPDPPETFVPSPFERTMLECLNEGMRLSLTLPWRASGDDGAPR